MSQNLVKISLLGKEYNVNCPPGQKEQLYLVIEELERRIAATKKKTMLQSNENILVMTALNLTSDLLELKATFDLLNSGKPKAASTNIKFP